jgi:hypothetical protein
MFEEIGLKGASSDISAIISSITTTRTVGKLLAAIVAGTIRGDSPSDHLATPCRRWIGNTRKG